MVKKATGTKGSVSIRCQDTLTVNRSQLKLLRKHETLPQCWNNAGASSATLARHYASIG